MKFVDVTYGVEHDWSVGCSIYYGLVPSVEHSSLKMTLLDNNTVEAVLESGKVDGPYSDKNSPLNLKEAVTNLSKKEQLELYKYMYNALDCRIN